MTDFIGYVEEPRVGYMHPSGQQCWRTTMGRWVRENEGIEWDAECFDYHGDSATDPSVGEWRSVVEHPKHYTWLPVEAIEITERFDFLIGNAIKYLIRHQHKGKPLEDLRKARFYVDRAIKNMESENDQSVPGLLR